jgi:phage FluMu protein Com
MENQKKYCCSNCRKVLFFGDIIEGFISKDCPSCGERNVFIVERISTERFELVKKEISLNMRKPVKKEIAVAVRVR